MAIVVRDRVRESSSTSGTGTLTLGGAAAGYQTFAAVGEGNQTFYTIVDTATGEWETGYGTYSSGTLTRDYVFESSAAGAKVNFSTNVKDVFCSYPAKWSVSQYDIGSDPNKIPLNQFLGQFAYVDRDSFSVVLTTDAVPHGVGEMVFYRIDDENIGIRYKGEDGTVRESAPIALSVPTP